jgi:hypothetical protein
MTYLFFHVVGSGVKAVYAKEVNLSFQPITQPNWFSIWIKYCPISFAIN